MKPMTTEEMRDKANAAIIQLMADILKMDSVMDELRALGYAAPTMQQVVNRAASLLRKQETTGHVLDGRTGKRCFVLGGLK